MARVYFFDLGVERAFIDSYDGWEETDVGMQFLNCQFNIRYSHHGANILHLNYGERRVEFYRGDYMVYSHPIKIVLD